MSYTRSKFSPNNRGKFTSHGWLVEDAQVKIISSKPSLPQLFTWGITLGLLSYVILIFLGVI